MLTLKEFAKRKCMPFKLKTHKKLIAGCYCDYCSNVIGDHFDKFPIFMPRKVRGT